MRIKLIVDIITVGDFLVNCYVLSFNHSGDAIVIDPGGTGREADALIVKKGLKPVAIVNTHGHADHISGNGFLKKKYDCQLYIHEDDSEMLINPGQNLSRAFGADLVSPPADVRLTDGSTLKLGEVTLDVSHTPGHSPGGIIIKAGDYVFTGDTIFNVSIGRTDFPGCSYKELINSIREKILVLDDDTAIYPGHGPNSTVGFERKHNPFLTSF